MSASAAAMARTILATFFVVFGLIAWASKDRAEKAASALAWLICLLGLLWLAGA